MKCAALNNFSASRAQSQVCLNYAEAMPKIMSEANNFAIQRFNDLTIPRLGDLTLLRALRQAQGPK